MPGGQRLLPILILGGAGLFLLSRRAAARPEVEVQEVPVPVPVERPAAPAAPLGPGITIRKKGLSAFIPLPFEQLWEKIFGRKPRPGETLTPAVLQQARLKLRTFEPGSAITAQLVRPKIRVFPPRPLDRPAVFVDSA